MSQIQKSLVQRPTKLSVSFICANLFNMKSDLDELRSEGVDYIHFDMMDGHFVPRLGSGTYFMRQLTKNQSIPIEVHLMVDDPAAYIDDIAEAGASMVTFHVETGKDEYHIIRKIKRHEMKVGVALRPNTPISSITPLLNDLDLVLLMAFSPGILGQSMMHGFNDRIAGCRRMLDQDGKNDVDIAVDGGIKPENIAILRSAGVNMFILGSSGLFVPGVTLRDQLINIKNSLEELKDGTDSSEKL